MELEFHSSYFVHSLSLALNLSLTKIKLTVETGV